MSLTTEVTLLIDNTVRGQGLLAEHGIAFWIETGSSCLLYDTGQGVRQAMPHNARRLEIPLGQTAAVVFSHGHYDHTGGMKDVLIKPFFLTP